MIKNKVGKENDKDNLQPMSFYLKQRKIITNLVIMTLVWLTSAFCYYLVLSLINTFEKIYAAGIISSVSELIAYIVSAALYNVIGT